MSHHSREQAQTAEGPSSTRKKRLATPAVIARKMRVDARMRAHFARVRTHQAIARIYQPAYYRSKILTNARRRGRAPAVSPRRHDQP